MASGELAGSGGTPPSLSRVPSCGFLALVSYKVDRREHCFVQYWPGQNFKLFCMQIMTAQIFLAF